MKDAIEPSLLELLDSVVTERTGLRIGPNRHADLDRGVHAVWRQLGFASARDCAAMFASGAASRRQIRALASHLTVGETYFFREKASFQLIEQHIFRHLICSRRGRDQQLRVWSAACCTGEEIYSVAILLDQILPRRDDWKIHLLATDINEHYLHLASQGVYNDWSFRETPTRVIDKFFTQTHPGRFRVDPHLRHAVRFSPLNLIDDLDSYPNNDTGHMDLILCRNVLIYMEDKQALKIVQKLSRCLAEGGWLLVGAAEGSQVRSAELRAAEISGVMAFQKCAGAIHKVHSTPVEAGELARGLFPGIPPIPVPPRSEAEDREQTGVFPGLAAPREWMATAAAAFEQQRYADVVANLLPLCTGRRANADAMELLARAYANQGEHELASAWCEQAIGAAKLDPRLHYLMATIREERGEIIEAAASYRRAIYLDPDFVMAHVGAGHLARRQGRHGESERHLNLARRILARFDPEQPVSEAEGITAKQLARLIERGFPHARRT